MSPSSAWHPPSFWFWPSSFLSLMVVERKGMEDGEAVRVQVELAVDPNAKIYRMGFSDKEVDKLLS